jgi:hypothetical protein
VLALGAKKALLLLLHQPHDGVPFLAGPILRSSNFSRKLSSSNFGQICSPKADINSSEYYG